MTSVPQLASLETLALAIEVQGSHAPDHLLRAGHYALELASRLGVDQHGQGMLQLAAVLHDVGELAVPRSILSKSGSLTPQEFEKMKTHAAIGALMAEHAGLPALVARMVRSHHERWDGSGYPDGLRGEAIPMGARILAVADCLAGCAAALQALRAGSGTIFDPRIVQVAVQGHNAIELSVRQASTVPRGPDFRPAIAGARREERLLHELACELGSSLSLPEGLSAFDTRLRDLIAYHCLAVYRSQGNRLVPVYVNGERAQPYCSLDIPYGEGPSGVAAATRQAVLNGDPSADGAHDPASADTGSLRSALAIPLESGGELIAVLALYHASLDAFGSEDLRILLAIRDRLALAVERAFQQERADQVAAVDTETGLPNGRALFQRLDADLARCRRNRATLALLVCEIDGFSRIHRLFGAGALERLRQAIASGLRGICREDDCVARMGENFVLALGGFSARDLPEKRRLIESLLGDLALTYSGEGPLVPRIGASYYPDDGAYAEDLLACADLRLNGARLE